MENSFTSPPPPPSFELTAPPPVRPPYSLTAIHTVRKPPSKPWRRPEPAPARVYRVEPRGFRRLVQRLTGAEPAVEAPARPLKEKVAAPPPLALAPRSLTAGINDGGCFPGEKTSVPVQVMNQVQSPAVSGGSLGFFSPTFYSGWCLSPLFSPGTIAALDHSTSSTVL